MADWMNNHVETNIQAALQSQSIQTVLEKNSMTLSDSAFTSFLTNAPIPRVFLAQQTTQAIANVTAVPLTWGGTANVFDPYQMQPSSNNALVRIPVGGFYIFVCQTQFNVVGSYSNQYMQFMTSTSKRLGASAQLAQTVMPTGAAGTSNAGNLQCTCTMPFDAGDSFFVNVFHTGGAAITTGGAQLTWLTGVWQSPYNTYNQAGGAQ